MDDLTAPPAVRELRGPLLVAAATVIIVVGIGLAGGLFGLLAFSALAAIVARRAQLWLLERGLPGWAAILITIGGFVLILVVMGIAVVAAVAAVGFRLGEDSSQVEAWITTAQDAWGQVTGVPPGSLPPIEPQAALGVARSVVSALAPAVTGLLDVGPDRDLRPARRRRAPRPDAAGDARPTSSPATTPSRRELVAYVKVRALARRGRRDRGHGPAARARRPVRRPVGR